MSTHFLTYGIALAIFLVIDAIWLFTATKYVYAPDLKPILRDTPNIAVAGGFYALFVAGLVYFVIAPGLNKPLWELVFAGAFFGLVCYATYDLTNLATLKDFTARVAVIDMAWGAFLSASVTLLTVYALRLLGKAG